MNFGPLASPQRGSTGPSKRDPLLQKLCDLDHELMGRNDEWDNAVEQAMASHSVDNLTDLYSADIDAVTALVDRFGVRESVTPQSILKQRLIEAAENPGFDRDAVNAIVAELKAAGFHIEGNEGTFVQMRLGSEEGSLERTPEEDEPMMYVVTPRRNWVRYVKSTSRDWTEEAEIKGDQFEVIMQKHGYELGSVGGHPPNFDYSSPDGNVTFVWHGNPHHI